MSTSKLDQALEAELATLQAEGRAKAPERVIEAYIPAQGARGPRYRLQGVEREFIRMNSNSYLSLTHHPKLIAAADAACHRFGTGPGAVRFIDGTFAPHVALERRIAAFVGKPAARIFNSAYTANCGLSLVVSNRQTYWIGDALNHNSIIRAMRIANIPRENRAIFPHNDMAALEKCLQQAPEGIARVLVIFDGVFSMRGDYAPIDRIQALADQHRERFADGVVTVVDDSHGIGAYGHTGRGTAEFTDTSPDVIIGTFGKAFGVNGGFIAGSRTLIEAVRQKADTYIYTNPLGPADCAAAVAAVDLCDGPEGAMRLQQLREQVRRFRNGITALGRESIPGPHPVVPLLVRDTDRTHRMVQHLFERGVLVVGLTFPVVPHGDETLRFQVNADHTPDDIDTVLQALDNFTH